MNKYIPKRRDSLFRTDSIKNGESIWAGKVILVRPLSFTFYSIIAVFLASLLIFFVMWAHYTKRETAIGFIRPEGGVTTVVPSVSGRVDKIFVTEGNKVNIGDPLFSIKVDLENNKGSLALQKSDEITKQIGFLKEGNENTKKLFLKQKEQTALRLQEFLSQKKSAETKRDLFAEKMELLKKEKENLEKMLSNRLISELEYNSKYKLYIDAKITLREIEETTTTVIGEIAKIRLDLKKLDLDLAQQDNSTNLAISQLQQRLIETTENQGYLIRAPIAGIVSTILVTPSNNVGPNFNVMSIVPENNKWIAELFVPTKAIGNINSDSLVFVKYDAFPYEKFGLYRGTIRTISKTILSRNNLPSEINAIEPMYRVLIDLDEQNVNLYGKQFDLQSGMTLTAELEGESRKLIGWFLGPLYDMKRTLGSKNVD